MSEHQLLFLERLRIKLMLLDVVSNVQILVHFIGLSES